MKELKLIHSRSTSDVVGHLFKLISSKLEEGKSVLWLLSGGSGGDICVEVSKMLESVPTDKLYVTVSDERHGSVGHSDENVAQLLEKGLVLGRANFYRPLQGGTREKDTARFSKWLTDAKDKVDYSVALLGVGADAHTSGVKPGSPAVESLEAAIDFDGEDFSRITTTLSFLSSLDELVVQSFGDSKHDMIKSLFDDEFSLSEQPIRFIEGLNYTFYSDYS